MGSCSASVGNLSFIPPSCALFFDPNQLAMIYLAVAIFVLFVIVVVYLYRVAARKAKEHKAKRNGTLPTTTQDLGERPTLRQTALDITGRVGRREECDEPYVPYHRRSLSTDMGRDVSRVEESLDPDLPTYRESTSGQTTLPARPAAAHVSGRRPGPIFGETGGLVPPPKYEAPSSEPPIVRTL